MTKERTEAQGTVLHQKSVSSDELHGKNGRKEYQGKGGQNKLWHKIHLVSGHNGFRYPHKNVNQAHNAIKNQAVQIDVIQLEGI